MGPWVCAVGSISPRAGRSVIRYACGMARTAGPWWWAPNVAVDHGAGMTLLVNRQGRLGCAIDTVRDDVSTDLAGRLGWVTWPCATT